MAVYAVAADKQSIDKILDLWQAYCIGETNIIYERFKFNNRNQTPDESVDNYAIYLRSLASKCTFGGLRDELIRDRIFCGISNIKVQQKLLQQPKLTLTRYIDIARSSERTTAQLKVIHGQTSQNDTDVHAVSNLRRNNTISRAKNNLL